MNLIKTRRRNNMQENWPEFKTLQDQINELFDMDFYPASTGLFDRNASPSIDAVETPEELNITCELPGVDKKDLNISVTGRNLTIQGEKKEEKTRKDRYFRKETWTGSFQRSLSLPQTVDTSSIDAELKDGVLTLVFPKKEEAKTKQISVSVK